VLIRVDSWLRERHAQRTIQQAAAEIAQRYSESVSLDWRLYRYDIAGSIAHAAAPAQEGIITADERQKIENELRAIEREIESGKFEWDAALEDVHMNIEAALTAGFMEIWCRSDDAESGSLLLQSRPARR
jgi:argininosuccinate lyase